METNMEDVTQTHEEAVCPNCEESFSVPKKEINGEPFPCPKCAFLISKKDSGKASDVAILSKLVAGAGKRASKLLFSVLAWILVAVVALVAGIYFVGLQWRDSFLRLGVRHPSPNASPASGGDIINAIGMKLKLIPAGSFMMGSNYGDADEKPVHKVTISKPFYIGVHEVSVEQYCDLMGERPLMPMPPTKPMLFVTWHKAKEFCKKLSERENARYRLPTEAEWEFSIRAGTLTEFYWGDKYTPGHEWCHYNSGRPTRSTHVIGTSEPNPWGLYDMGGNVQEWCEDYYSNSYSSNEQTDPKGPSSGDFRVIRGGGYHMTEGALRSASRGKEVPETQMGPGFRVVKEIQGG